MHRTRFSISKNPKQKNSGKISLSFLDKGPRNRVPSWRATHSLADHDNITPTTAPTMYMAQAERLIRVLVDLNMKYSPRSAIPKLPAIVSFAT
jgi:hypothetical protein